jgi:hypothetical protein
VAQKIIVNNGRLQHLVPQALGHHHFHAVPV